MNDSSRSYSNRLSDYQKVRTETVTLVAALTNGLNNLGNNQAGISLIYPSEGLEEGGKAFTRIFLVSPVEIAKQTLTRDLLSDRLRELVVATPIRYDAKRHEHTYLDVNSQEYISLQHRVVTMLETASANFRKDIDELMQLFDAYTQPSAKQPNASTFHLRAAFANRELIEAYRRAAGLLQPPPSLTAEMREMLTRRGVSTHGIPDRSADAPGAIPAAGMAGGALPVQAAQLREAAQGSQYGREVQMILHVLGEAIIRKEIANLVMDHQFREALAKVIADARPMPAGFAPHAGAGATSPTH